MIYQSINQAVFERIPTGTRSLLDVGCGGGVFGAAVKSAGSCEVVGVTYSEAEAEQARQRIDRVVCSHVLEHLHDPHQVLSRLHACLAPGGTLLVACPTCCSGSNDWNSCAGDSATPTAA